MEIASPLADGLVCLYRSYTGISIKYHIYLCEITLHNQLKTLVYYVLCCQHRNKMTNQTIFLKKENTHIHQIFLEHLTCFYFPF